MEVLRLYERVYLTLMKIFRLLYVKREFWKYKKLFKRNGKTLTPLTREQKNEIKQLWKPKGIFNYDTHKLVYWATGKFDAKIVPEVYVRTCMEYKLNNQMAKFGWDDKNIFDIVLSKEYTPKVIVRSIDGVLYDRDYEYLTVEDAVRKINTYDRVFFKPSIYSTLGRGIKVLNGAKEADLKTVDGNFVVQEMIQVHPFLQQLDSTKVVVMRMISFYIEGKVYVTSASVLVGIGKENKMPEVRRRGNTCIVIGITDDGRLKDYGYYPSGERTSSVYNGLEFGGMQVPGFDKAVNLLKKLHKRLPHHRFVGWDVTIDENGEPLIVEYNIKSPGVLYYQYSNGSLFGEAFEEIYNSL